VPHNSQPIVFLRRRQVEARDLWTEAAGAVLLGLVPSALEQLDSLPDFYAGFFRHTEWKAKQKAPAMAGV
jgi:hypothetical protein